MRNRFPLPLVSAALFTLLTTLHLAAATIGQTGGDYVILLHGAGRTPLSMKPMEIYLRQHGYRVINLRFHSAGLSIEQIAESSLPKVLAGLDPRVKVHFVAHSMGAIIVRQYLACHDVPNLGRVVMIGPPNHGSELVDWARPNPLLRFCLGQRLLELGTGVHGLPGRLGSVHFECGVIAGDCSFNPLSSFVFHAPNDGKVTVDSARVDGMRDFMVAHISHTCLIWRKSVFRQTARFLESGKFDRTVLPLSS